ncbi:MAG: glycosyltransferase [bacterium]
MIAENDRSISIIIVSYNTRDLLRNCLRSILNDDSGLISEIIVVDNNSSDGSPEMVSQEFPGVTLIRNQQNLGYAKAVNQGIQKSKSDYFLILNPDIEVLEGAIINLWRFMESHQDAGIAGAQLLNPDGSIQLSCRTFYTFTVFLLRRTPLGRLFPDAKLLKKHLMMDWDHQSDREVDWVIGACLMVRRSAFESVGGMDERFFLYFEDVDWCYRMRKNGWQVYYVHSAKMKHLHRRDSARLLPTKNVAAHFLSMMHFYDKWDSIIYRLKRGRRFLAVLVTLVSDLVGINLAFLLAYLVRYLFRLSFEKPLYSVEVYWGFILFVNLICIFAFVYSGLYKLRGRSSFIRDLILISRSLLLSSLVIMAATYLTRTIAYSRFIVILFWPIAVFLTAGGRAVVRHIHIGMRQRLFDLTRVAVVGWDEEAREIGRRIADEMKGFEFVGFIHPVDARDSNLLQPHIGSTDSIGRVIIEQRIGEVVVCQANLPREKIGDIVMEATRSGCVAKVVSDVLDFVIRGSQLDEMVGRSVVIFPPSALSGINLLSKRIVDFLLAFLGIVALSLLSPLVLMFQTLRWRNYSALSHAFNALAMVLSGKRTLVGPKKSIDGEGVKAGITGVWRVGINQSVGYSTNMDLYYTRNWSLTGDLEIVICSIALLKKLFGPENRI